MHLTDYHPLRRTAVVSFGSVERLVNVALVPEAGKGDVVLVHAGIAISLMTESDREALSQLLRSATTPSEDLTRGTSS